MTKDNYNAGLNISLPKSKVHLVLLVIGFLLFQMFSFLIYDKIKEQENCKNKYTGRDLKLSTEYSPQKINSEDIWVANNGNGCKFSGWINHLERGRTSYYISNMEAFGYD